MKKQLLHLFAITLLSNALIAQFTQTDATMSEGVQPGLEFEVKGESRKAEKVWKDYTKNLGKLNWDKKAKEYTLPNALLPAIESSSPITLVAKFDEFSNMTRVKVWIKEGDVFLTEQINPNKIAGAKVFLTDYSYLVEKVYVGEELNEEEKNLNKLEKELDRLSKQNENLHRDIEKAKDAIKKAEREIVENNNEQEAKKKEIEEQQAKVKQVSDKLNKIGSN